MKKEKYYDTVICDRCNNYSCHPSGVSETCWAYLKQNEFVKRMTKDYVKERMNGNKNFCKEFDRITTKEL